MTVEAAIALHEQGDPAAAEQLCREVLQHKPGDADAAHLLGVLLLHAGRPQEAADWIVRSLDSNPRQPAAHLNLGVAQQGLNRLQEALVSFERALRLTPEYAEAHNNRGDVLMALQRPAEALQSFERAVRLEPNFAIGLNNQGNALRALGRPSEALASYELALGLAPHFVRAVNNRGNALRELNRHEEALAAFEEALRLDSKYAPALYNRGNALLELKRYDEALAGFERLLQRYPDDAHAFAHRGIALLELERHEEALASFDRALELHPDLVPALVNRGNALAALRRFAEAVRYFDKTLQIEPDNAEIYCNRAQALRAMERFEDALRDYQRALGHKPDLAHALFSCAMILVRLQRHGEAVAYFARLEELEPAYPYALGAAFLARSQICDWSDDERRRQQLVNEVLKGSPAAAPLGFLAVASSAAAQLKCARINAQDRFPAMAKNLGPAAPFGHERIRLAYVSGDLRNHAVAHLLVGVIEQHDRERFEINAISFKPPQSGSIGERVHRAFDRFIEVGGRTDGEIAAVIRAMEVDIAIDLAGYTEGNHLGVFAQRPAPVQVEYLGYAGTTAAPYMDYLMADGIVIPPGDEHCYTEQIVRLPHCYLPNDDRRPIAALPTRAAAGLPEGGFVFCAFTNAYKINSQMFDIWMRVLRAVPDSLLWLRTVSAEARDNLAREAGRRGVDGGRLIFAPHVADMADHLARQSLADLYLDTLPYNAHSTTCDSLWAGVPVLTCVGQSFAGRVAASALSAAGLPELIADSLEDYEAKAIKLARQPERLQAFRWRLEQNRAVAPLFDTASYRRFLESAYLTMHERARRGEPAAAFTITP